MNDECNYDDDTPEDGLFDASAILKLRNDDAYLYQEVLEGMEYFLEEEYGVSLENFRGREDAEEIKIEAYTIALMGIAFVIHDTTTLANEDLDRTIKNLQIRFSNYHNALLDSL